MCLFLLHYALQGLEMSKRHCNAKVAFVLILSILRIFELLSIKQFVISSFLRRLKYKKHVFRRLSPLFLVAKESLFWYQREPLFFKSGKSDIFCSKKFVMSLFRTIFAFENGREMANLGFVFPECLRSGFALPSLPEAKKRGRQEGDRRETETRQKPTTTNKPD